MKSRFAVPPEELDGSPWVVACGFAAVAQTGSVAVRSVEVPRRLELLLPEGLVLLVPSDSLVDELWHLYARVGTDALAGGYFTLISGPSRTADIELKMVTGAHGPRALVVLAYEPSS